MDGFNPRLKPVHQGLSFRWRSCRRQQQRMVASGANAGRRPAGETSEAIRLKPFCRIGHQRHGKVDS